MILDLDAGPYVRGIATASAATGGFIKQLDASNDRASLIVQSVLALAPAAVTTMAAATPAISGLTAQLGFAAAAAGVMVLGTVGVGDALEALNKYQLEKTPENLEKLEDAFRNLGPGARDFVLYLDEISPQLQKLREEAQEGFLPGVEDGIDELLTRLPQLRSIISEIAQASGDLVEATGRDLAGGDWDEFFDYLENEARPTIISFGQTFGNVLEGLANTMMAMDPASDDFVRGLLEWSEGFAEATAGLDENARFQSFLDYVRANGPQAVDTLASLADMLIAFGEAAAPVGAATLPILQAVAEVLAAIARSPVGPLLIAAAAGISLVSRAVALYNAANGSAMVGMLRQAGPDGTKGAGGLSAFGKAALGLAAISVAIPVIDGLITKLSDVAPTAEEAKAALLGLASGDPLPDDMFEGLDDKIGRLADPLIGEKIGDTVFGAVGLEGRNLKEATGDIEAIDAALRDMVSSGNADQAAAALAELEGSVSPERYRLLTEELLPEYNDELLAQANAAELAGEGSDEAARGMLRAERAASRLRERQAALTKALGESREAAREQAQMFVNVAAAAEDGQASIAEFTRNLAKQARDLREFRINAQDAADKGLDEGLIESLRELGPAGARLMRQFADATEAEINRANAAHRAGQREIDRTTDAVGGIPKVHTTILTVLGAKEAINDTRELYNAIAQLRNKTVTVTTVFTSSGQRFKEFGASAYGSTIPDDGGGYRDYLPYMLAPREEVVANDVGQADYFRDTLKAINAGASEEAVAATIPRIYETPTASERGGGGVRERVVETFPRGGVRATIDGLGDVMIRVADARIDAEWKHRDRMNGKNS